jgi:stage II sporulation protein D
MSKIIFSLLVLFFLGGKPVEFGRETVFFQEFPIPKPVIRIALGLNLDDVLIHASSGMVIYQAAENYRSLADDASDVWVKDLKEALAEIFFVQVAQFRRRDEAEEIARNLRSRIDRPVSVAEGRTDDLEGVFQVRVGDFLTRGEASAYISILNTLGFPKAWIIREEVPERESKRPWVMVNDELVNLDGKTSLYFVPMNPHSYLNYGGKNYRGIFVLRGSLEGTILINVLNLEDYLISVVPGELSPYHFGEIEALKAQAIAARTYALKNLGRFDDLGFDLYATPQSQLYEGMSLEHPQSSLAVEETKGEVVVYAGKLINALYTSTCGGATEDAEAMFGGKPIPYLKSTECVMENDQSWTVQTGQSLPPYFVSGENISRKTAILAALGILAPDGGLDWYKSPIPPEEAASWVEKAALAVGRKTDDIKLQLEAATPSAFGRWIVDAFGWSERTETFIGESESEHANENPAGFEAEERSPLADFPISGAYPPMTSAALHEVLTRAEAAAALSCVIGLYRDPFHQANLNSVEKNVLLVTEEGETRSLDLSPNPYLLRSLEGSASFSLSLDLEPGDAVQWIEHEGKVRLLQVQSIPLSNVHDQPSQYHSWQVRTAQKDLEARLNEYYPIGKLIDIVPRKHGTSQRVIELSVIGTKSQVLVTGLKIRQVLNLRDNPFVIDRETDEEGQPTHFLFLGKGWGHGVGLCQIGAFRMAQKGATYEEILKKYYRGIKIEKWTEY